MKTLMFVIAALIIIAIGISVEWSRNDSQTRRVWQQAVVPGSMSQSHAFLVNNCAACHTPVSGVNPTLCIACHADNKALLQRQPTAFHGNIQVCSGCHLEHQGSVRMPTTMDHALLSLIGHRELAAAKNASSLSGVGTNTGMVETEGCGGEAGCSGANLEVMTQMPVLSGLPIDHPRNSSDEAMLNCVSCHATKDRHQGLFGSGCVQCHVTKQWTNPKFVHPSTSSTECAQCHKPPPSHNMMHFTMMSAPTAKQPNAKVSQCYLCHQSTSWNDIKGVGWIKHH